jgi:hypothetical protein
MFAPCGKHLQGDQFRREFSNSALNTIDKQITVSVYRQIASALIEKHCGYIHPEIEPTAAELQFAHSYAVHKKSYATSQYDFRSVSRDDFFYFSQVSNKWHELLSLESLVSNEEGTLETILGSISYESGDSSDDDSNDINSDSDSDSVNDGEFANDENVQDNFDDDDDGNGDDTNNDNYLHSHSHPDTLSLNKGTININTDNLLHDYNHNVHDDCVDTNGDYHDNCSDTNIALNEYSDDDMHVTVDNDDDCVDTNDDYKLLLVWFVVYVVWWCCWCGVGVEVNALGVTTTMFCRMMIPWTMMKMNLPIH